MSRPTAPAPVLPGFEYVALLGSGGFADVYRYEQLGLGRQVAVKVLLTDIDTDVHASFAVEASVMAQLSNHPSIVSIYQAGTTVDGRPFLVMEYCPPPHLGVRLGSRPLPVGKALEVVIQLCGAVETAHRLGILHRDIKPANILFTEFGRAALTDFGISVNTNRAGAGEGIGVSVPWAPPEQLSVGAPMGPSGDVYSLAATLWAALVGRSPFYVPKGDNGSVAMTARVRRMPVPQTHRPDVPESLERALRTAMAKAPDQRYDTALAFARALQGIQAELHQPVTTIDVLDEQVVETVAEEAGGTRVSGFVAIDPDGPRAAAPPAAPARPGPGTASGEVPVGERELTRLRTPGDAAGGGSPFGTPPAAPGTPAEAGFLSTGSTGAGSTGTGPVGTGPPTGPGPQAPSRLPAIVLGILVVAAVVAAAVWFGTRAPGGTEQADPPPVRPSAADPIGPAGPLPPESIVVERAEDQLTVTWENPDPQPGDIYLLHLQADPAALSLAPEDAIESEETSVVLPSAGERCVTVRTVRGSQQSEPVLSCDLS